MKRKNVDTNGSSSFTREFKCPAHACWTCCQKDMVEKEKQQAAETRKTGKKKGKKKSNSSFGEKTGQLTIVSDGLFTPRLVVLPAYSSFFLTLAMPGLSNLVSLDLYPTHGSFQRALTAVPGSCGRQQATGCGSRV